LGEMELVNESSIKTIEVDGKIRQYLQFILKPKGWKREVVSDKITLTRKLPTQVIPEHCIDTQEEYAEPEEPLAEDIEDFDSTPTPTCALAATQLKSAIPPAALVTPRPDLLSKKRQLEFTPAPLHIGFKLDEREQSLRQINAPVASNASDGSNTPNQSKKVKISEDVPEIKPTGGSESRDSSSSDEIDDQEATLRKEESDLGMFACVVQDEEQFRWLERLEKENKEKKLLQGKNEDTSASDLEEMRWFTQVE